MAFSPKPVAHLTGSNGPIHAVTYSSSSGTYILTGSADRTIRLYNPQPASSSASAAAASPPQGRLIQTYEAHGYEVLSLAVSGSNTSFVSGGGDRGVFLWDVASASTTRRFGGGAHGHTSRVNCVAFAGEGDAVVASGGFDTTVRLWDARSPSARPIQVLDEARDAVTCLAVRGAEVVAGSVDGRVRSYDVRVGACTTDVVGGRDAGVTSVALTRDARAMLVGTLDSTLRLMDRDDGACLRAYRADGWRNDELRLQSVLGAKERYVLVGDEMTGDGGAAETAPSNGEGRVLVWDLLSGKMAAKVPVPWGGPEGYEARKKVVGRDGKEKVRKNVVSCMAWRDDGWGDQFCVGGTSGVVTVFAA
ncbi:WD domain-containing [Cordyceps militaris]|uniref:WD domain-containing n=1 Tax=Cordyceps militaris TaxID=73501 RepID=A0A2H4S5P0_CORMI|nr:WD domain-containing [Cordyceps militaris]